MADDHVVREFFCDLLQADLEKSPALAAVETLFQCLKISQATTVNGLTDELRRAVSVMEFTDYSSTSVESASEIFMRFISRAFLDQPRILTHSFSRVVYQTILAAAQNGKVFHVYVTESRPDSSGEKMKEKLETAGIRCTLIIDGAAAYLMESIDCVFFGAEGVMETGGIINKIGSYSIAVCAKALNKPVYVMAESIKFVKEYPLNQKDIPQSFKYPASVLQSGRDLEDEHPLVDYTPPNYIKLLFTDLGIVTPAAVSDKLMKLYI